MAFTFEPYDSAKDYPTIGYIMGAGTNSDPVTSQSTGINFIDFRTKSTATTGDIRGMYLRHYLSGGAGGDGARIFATVDSAIGTAQGAHISLSYGATGATSGQAIAMRGTLHIADRATSIGTAAAVQAEVFCDGNDSAATGTLSLFRAVVDGGDETARNTVDYFMTGVQLGSNIFAAESSAAVSHTLKCNINGTDYYIMLSDAA